MKRKFSIFLKKVYRSIVFWTFGFYKLVFKLLVNKKLYDSNETYYPELVSKSKFSIIFDRIKYIIKWRNIDEYYFLYGFDIKNFRDKSQFLDYKHFMQRRDYLNRTMLSNDYSFTGIMRDKFYFAVFMEKFGFNVPKSFGLINNGYIYVLKTNTNEHLSKIIEYDGDYICKPLDGIGGIGIFLLEIKKGKIIKDKEEISIEELKNLVANNRFFIQDRIPEQHPLMDSLYSKSINTLRITTARSLKTGKIEIMGCMLLMGARGALVSNWHYGGVIIDINPDGSLNKFGFSLYEKKITSHPETGVVFETFKVPLFEEAIKQSIKCHEIFYGIHSVGWDLAVLPNKVVFLEANDNWGMAAHQMVGGGLTEKFNKYYFK